MLHVPLVTFAVSYSPETLVPVVARSEASRYAEMYRLGLVAAYDLIEAIGRLSQALRELRGHDAEICRQPDIEDLDRSEIPTARSLQKGGGTGPRRVLGL